MGKPGKSMSCNSRTHKKAVSNWLPCHWEIWKTPRSSAKTENDNLPSHNILWFWIIPGQNEENWGHCFTCVWKHPCADFSERWRHSWTCPHAYLWHPKDQIKKFMEELERRGKNIWAVVREEFLAEDFTCSQGSIYGASRMVWPGACSLFQLQALWFESDQRTFCRAERMKDGNATIPLLEQWPEKSQALNRIRTHDLCITSSMLCQLSYQSHMSYWLIQCARSKYAKTQSQQCLWKQAASASLTLSTISGQALATKSG